MKQLVYFLMVGLAFTALQVVTVEAQEGYPDMEPPMCDREPCDPGMALEGNETGMALEGNETAMPLVDAADTMALEGDHRRLPAPEDMGKFFEYDQEYRTNGVLSQASYDELSEDGYTKKRVDWILNTNQGTPPGSRRGVGITIRKTVCSIYTLNTREGNLMKKILYFFIM